MNHIQLCATNNLCESFNYSLSCIQPKFLYHKYEEGYDLYSYIVAIKTNFGSSGLKNILFEIGYDVNNIPSELLKCWHKVDIKKERRRINQDTDEYRKRRLELKKKRKQDSLKVRQNNPKEGCYKPEGLECTAEYL